MQISLCRGQAFFDKTNSGYATRFRRYFSLSKVLAKSIWSDTVCVGIGLKHVKVFNLF